MHTFLLIFEFDIVYALYLSILSFSHPGGRTVSRQQLPFDLAFSVDGSSDMASYHYGVGNFMKKLLSRYHIHPDYTHVALSYVGQGNNNNLICIQGADYFFVWPRKSRFQLANAKDFNFLKNKDQKKICEPVNR